MFRRPGGGSGWPRGSGGASGKTSNAPAWAAGVLSAEALDLISKRTRDIQCEAAVGDVNADGVWSNEERYVSTVLSCLHRVATALELRLAEAVPPDKVQALAAVFDLLLDPVLFGDDKETVLAQSEAAAAQTPGGGMCGYIFQAGDFTFHCADCSADATCVMCARCFKNSNHDGHRIRFFTSSATGGYCDCGDPEAIVPTGFCCDHGQRAPDAAAGTITTDAPAFAPNGDDPVRAELPLPTARIQRLLQPTVRAMCDFMHEVLVFKAVVSMQDEALSAFVAWHSPEASAAASFSPAQLEHAVLRNVFRLVAHSDEVHSSQQWTEGLCQALPNGATHRVIRKLPSIVETVRVDGFLSLDKHMQASRCDLDTMLAARRRAQQHVRLRSAGRAGMQDAGLHLSVVSEAYQRDAFLAVLAFKWLGKVLDWGAPFAAVVADQVSSPRTLSPFYTAQDGLGVAGAVPLPETIVEAVLANHVLLENTLAQEATMLIIRLVTKDLVFKVSAARAMVRSYSAAMELQTRGFGGGDGDDNDAISALNVNIVTVPSILFKICGRSSTTKPPPVPTLSAEHVHGLVTTRRGGTGAGVGSNVEARAAVTASGAREGGGASAAAPADTATSTTTATAPKVGAATAAKAPQSKAVQTPVAPAGTARPDAAPAGAMPQGAEPVAVGAPTEGTLATTVPTGPFRSTGSAAPSPPAERNFFCVCLEALNYMLGTCYSRNTQDGAFLNLDSALFDTARYSQPLTDLGHALDCSNGLQLFVRASLRAHFSHFPDSDGAAPCFDFVGEALETLPRSAGPGGARQLQLLHRQSLVQAARDAVGLARAFQDRKMAFLQRQSGHQVSVCTHSWFERQSENLP